MSRYIATRAIRGAKAVVTAVGGRDVIIKKIQMDRMKESEAREVIRWEAEQHVPFDIKSVELDFQILNPGAQGLQMEVLLVAAKRELVEGKLALLAESGLGASIIDVEAFAHGGIRLCRDGYLAPEERGQRGGCPLGAPLAPGGEQEQQDEAEDDEA